MFPLSILSLEKRFLGAALLNVEKRNKGKENYSHTREKTGEEMAFPLPPWGGVGLGKAR